VQLSKVFTEIVDICHFSTPYVTRPDPRTPSFSKGARNAAESLEHAHYIQHGMNVANPTLLAHLPPF
jgi:hypothetical protein